MRIRDGELVTGRLQKRTLGSSHGGIVHVLWLTRGASIAASFVDSAQRLANTFLMSCTFSIGLSDATPTIQAVKEVNEEVTSKADATASRGRDVGLKDAAIEGQIGSFLNPSMATCGKLAAEECSNTNAVLQAVQAQSKGSNQNFAQVLACLGQQSVAGKRLGSGYVARSSGSAYTQPKTHKQIKKDIEPQLKEAMQQEQRNSIVVPVQTSESKKQRTVELQTKMQKQSLNKENAQELIDSAVANSIETATDSDGSCPWRSVARKGHSTVGSTPLIAVPRVTMQHVRCGSCVAIVLVPLAESDVDALQLTYRSCNKLLSIPTSSVFCIASPSQSPRAPP